MAIAKIRHIRSMTLPAIIGSHTACVVPLLRNESFARGFCKLRPKLILIFLFGVGFRVALTRRLRQVHEGFRIAVNLRLRFPVDAYQIEA